MAGRSGVNVRATSTGWRRSLGFTLLELSVAMIVIALILGAVMRGNELIRTAEYLNQTNTFVTGWLSSFRQFMSTRHFVPGSDPAEGPTGRVGSRLRVAALCNTGGLTQLSDEFLANGITIPDGEGRGLEDEYLYNDDDDTPRRIRACFATVQWTEKGTSVRDTALVDRHVLRLTGVTRGLAEMLDTQMDGRINAQDGDVRAEALAASGDLSFAAWPRNDINFDEVTVLIAINR